MEHYMFKLSETSIQELKYVLERAKPGDTLFALPRPQENRHSWVLLRDEDGGFTCSIPGSGDVSEERSSDLWTHWCSIKNYNVNLPNTTPKCHYCGYDVKTMRTNPATCRHWVVAKRYFALGKDAGVVCVSCGTVKEDGWFNTLNWRWVEEQEVWERDFGKK